MSDIYRQKANKYKLKYHKLINELKGGNIKQQKELKNLINLINSIKKIITTISKEKNILGNISVKDIFDSNYDVKEDIIYYKLDEKQLDNYPLITQLIMKYFFKIKDKDKKYLKNELIQLLLNEKKSYLDEKLKEFKKEVPDIEERYKNIYYEFFPNEDNFNVYEWVDRKIMFLLNEEQLYKIFKDLSDSYEYDLEDYAQIILNIAIIDDIFKLWDYFLNKALNILIHIPIHIRKDLIRELVFFDSDIRDVLSILNIHELLIVFDEIIVELYNINYHISISNNRSKL
jgi:hypothetical protein